MTSFVLSWTFDSEDVEPTNLMKAEKEKNLVKLRDSLYSFTLFALLPSLSCSVWFYLRDVSELRHTCISYNHSFVILMNKCDESSESKCSVNKIRIQ